MASLLSSASVLGAGANVSSLIKGASSLAYDIAEANDEAESSAYSNDHSDTGLATYTAYLNSRITQLNAQGTGAAIIHAQSLQDSLGSAVKSNMTFDIQSENIQVLNGNATDQDKLNLINSEFSRAMSIGDTDTAQTLLSQASSLSQTIQDQAQTSADAAKTLASAGASQENNVATQVEDNFKNLNDLAKAGGMAGLNKNLKSWVSTNKAQLETLASGPGISSSAKASIEKAINTSQPNYQDIAVGVGQAIIAAHYLAYQQELPIDPETAQGYLDSATAYADGTTSISTLAGDRTMDELQQWQANPAMFVPHENADSGSLAFSYSSGGLASGESSVNGYKYNANGQVEANFTGNDTGTKLNAGQVTQTNTTLKKLGFTYKPVSTGDANTNGFSVQDTGDLPKWLQPIFAGQKNVEVQAYVTPQGIELATLDANNQGHVYMIASDGKDLHAVYTGTPDKNGNVVFNKQAAAGEYGFDQNKNSIVDTNKNTNNKILVPQKDIVAAGKQVGGSSFGISNVKSNIESWLGIGSDIAHNISQIIDSAQATTSKMQAQQAQASANIKLNMPVLAPIPVKMPNPKVTAVAMPQVTANPQQTGNPQAKTANPQAGTVSPQGSNVNPQQGGTKVATLTPTTGQGIKL